MKSVKCPRCGLVGSSANERCRRCEAPLGSSDRREQQQHVAGSVTPAPQAHTASSSFDNLKQCPACYFVHSRSAESCPNCGHLTTLTLVAKGISKGVAAVLILVLLSVLFGTWRFYAARAAAEAQLAAQYGMLMPEGYEQPRPKQPEKLWFWSLFRSQPTVEEILEQHTKASGGHAFVSINSQRASGDISIVNRAKTPHYDYVSSSGKVVFQTKAPDKAEAVMEITEQADIRNKQWARYGFDGTLGWESVVRSRAPTRTEPAPQPTNTLRESYGADLELVKQFSVLMKLARPKDFYSSLVLTGQEKVGRDVSRGKSDAARDSYVVRGLSKENRFETFYFDAVTGLLMRHDFEAVEAGKTLAVECYLEDYRDVGGVKLPFNVVYKVLDLVITYKLDEHRLNGQIDDSVFKMPIS
ncbi:MAG TPA: hypothetical protein VGV59_18005 [Pyrinomonadaceae bacterium]|nr:hypothetical protein [Pyrinomonadaceae bacterium]